MQAKTNSSEPLVSVIIPTYNRPDYLKQAIESAVKQTYQNMEIIVSDDCGPEKEAFQKIVGDFQDSRITLRRNVNNLGVTLNFVEALKEAQGKYIACLNDDDLWNQDFLEKLIPPLEENPDLALAFCDHYIMDAEGEINYPETERITQYCHRDRLKQGVYKPFCKLGLIDNSVPISSAAVLRKDVDDLTNIPAEVETGWDLYLNYLCCRSGRGAYFTPERLVRYRVHEQSYTQSYSRKNIEANIRTAKAEIFCTERFMQDDRLEELKPYLKRRLAYFTTSLGINLLRSQKVVEARSYLLSALGQHLNVRTLAAFLLSFTPPSLASRF